MGIRQYVVEKSEISCFIKKQKKTIKIKNEDFVSIDVDDVE